MYDNKTVLLHDTVHQIAPQASPGRELPEGDLVDHIT